MTIAMLPTPMLGRASKAVCNVAEGALKSILAVVTRPKLKVNVPRNREKIFKIDRKHK